ncbi:hypothetical protein N9Q76_00810 [Flavobacteriales bacterium]|nr:hypothetical protein [Flavobacteriales bacterium]
MRKIFLTALTIILIATSCRKDDTVVLNANSDSNSYNLGDNAELVKELRAHSSKPN